MTCFRPHAVDRSKRARAMVLAGVGTLLMVAACTSASTSPSGGTTSSAATTATAGPSATGPVPVGSSVHTIIVGATRRSFRVYRPASLASDRSVPLVVMIHGGGGSAAGAEASYGWDAEADRGHFVVAYPDGVDHGWSVGGGCCAATGAGRVDDVGFLTELVVALRRQLPIDPRRVYATGISEGGLMSYRLACDTSIFAAIGPDSATLLGACNRPTPLSVIAVHGTADTRIRYDGRPGSGVHRIDGPSVPALNGRWRDVDNCAAPRVARAGAVTTSTASCPHGRAVELITIAGAGHQWPGARCNRRCAAGTADPPSTALSATAVIWTFFAAHPG